MAAIKRKFFGFLGRLRFRKKAPNPFAINVKKLIRKDIGAVVLERLTYDMIYNITRDKVPNELVLAQGLRLFKIGGGPKEAAYALKYAGRGIKSMTYYNLQGFPIEVLSNLGVFKIKHIDKELIFEKV